MKRRIAVPSHYPGGMDARLGAHFGLCDCFTVIDEKKGHAGSERVRVVDNICRDESARLTAVNLLLQHRVNVVIVDEIDGFSLAALQFGGVEVYRGFGSLVSTALKDYRHRMLPPLFYGSPQFGPHDVRV